jgi:hypothetical protein
MLGRVVPVQMFVSCTSSFSIEKGRVRDLIKSILRNFLSLFSILNLFGSHVHFQMLLHTNFPQKNMTISSIY